MPPEPVDLISLPRLVRVCGEQPSEPARLGSRTLEVNTNTPRTAQIVEADEIEYVLGLER
jgi:hypothetical protein